MARNLTTQVKFCGSDGFQSRIRAVKDSGSEGQSPSMRE
jgi:hypothetical protein